MKLFETLFDVVVGIPVAIVKDAVTLGGLAAGKEESYTKEQAQKIDEDIKDED